jgi:uncharacterized phage protein (TIGR02216 family)
MAERFPWDTVMAFGFGVLRLSPRDFWAMTPREMAAAMRAFGIERRAPMTGGDLDKLMRRFPDG